MSPRTIALLAIIIVAIQNSGTAAIAKKGLTEIPPLSLAFLRFVLASLIVLPFFLKKKYKFSQMRPLFPISLFAVFNVIFFILGVNFTTANIATVIYAAVPLLVAVILYFFFKEKLNKRKSVGISIGFIGVLIVTLLPLLEKGNPFAGNLLGNIFLATAVIFWSFYMVYSKRLQTHYSPFMITSCFIFIVTVVLFPFFLWDLQMRAGWWHHITGWGVLAIFYMGVIITVLGYTLFQYAIKHGGSVFAATTFYITPVMGFVVNFWLLGERLTPGFIFGSILALLGTYLVVKK